MTKPLHIVGYVTQLRAERNGPVSAPLVLKADADAVIAKRDAEIAHYRVALTEAQTFHEEQDKSLSKQPPSFQGLWRRNLHQEQIEQIDAALKGPEA